MNKKDKKFIIQESKYTFPYHHLVSFPRFKNYKILSWGIEYYGYLSKIIDIINNSEFNSLLDVGCGDGKLIFEIMRLDYSGKKHIVGADLSKRAINFAKAFNYKNGAKFYYGDFADIKERFDIITLIETLEHIPDRQVKEFIENLFERLNQNGKLIVSVPSKNLPLIPKHYRHYDIETLKNQFYKFEHNKTYYLIKDGMFCNFIIKISKKFGCLRTIRKLVFVLSKRFLFQADKSNARHIVCIFSKEKIN